MRSRKVGGRYSLVRWAGHGTVHGTDRTNKTNTENKPRVGSHQSITPSVHVHSTSSDGNDTDTKTGVKEGLIEVGLFEGWHTTIFTSLTIEDEVDGDKSPSEDGATIDEALCEVSLSDRVGK